MEFKMCTIASGSSGNCTYLQAGNVSILIDAGISGKKIEQGLQEIGVLPQAIQGIFITHEHSDHIKGVGIFSRRYDVPIYATQPTWLTMQDENMLGKIKEENIKILEKEKTLAFDELRIFPYSIYHDATDPVGYTFNYDDKKITLATDLGMVDERILANLRGTNGILLEFNHDVNMLEAGGYPFYLKKRILSDVGHLSNEVAAQVLIDIYHKDLQWAILGHLSRENNLPDLAYLTAKNALEENNLHIGKDIEVIVASRDSVSPVYSV
ncbi:MAG: MBL fold metallo-hydrolase [Cellulosilyticaceae bacterium]